MSPNSERKHIHFNEKVEQCIAVEVKGDDDTDATRIDITSAIRTTTTPS